MILSNDTTNENLPQLSRQEAFIGILMTIVAADGNVSDEEMDGVASIITRSKLLKEMNHEQFAAAWGKSIELLRAHGFDDFRDMAIAQLPEEYYISIYTIACDLVFFDGRIDENEVDSIDDLQIKLSIDDDLADMTIRVIANKNCI